MTSIEVSSANRFNLVYRVPEYLRDNQGVDICTGVAVYENGNCMQAFGEVALCL